MVVAAVIGAAMVGGTVHGHVGVERLESRHRRGSLRVVEVRDQGVVVREGVLEDGRRLAVLVPPVRVVLVDLDVLDLAVGLEDLGAKPVLGCLDCRGPGVVVAY